MALADNTHAWLMQPDGGYIRAAPAEGESEADLQNDLWICSEADPHKHFPIRSQPQSAAFQTALPFRQPNKTPNPSARFGAYLQYGHRVPENRQIRIGITIYLKFGLFGTVNSVERLASPKASCISSEWMLRNTSIK